jgi:APA family basic amino acid/polyamine antiporter
MAEKIELSHEGKSVQRHLAVLERGHLSRKLGVFDLYAVGFGDVGSSVYYALGVTVLYAMGAAPIAIALAAFFFVCTVLTYSELSASIPEAGGSANFARFAFNDLVSFIAGWALLLAYIMTLAISAYTVGPYLSVFFPVLKSQIYSIPANVIFTIGIIVILCLINIIGIKESTRVSIVLAIFSLILKLFIVVSGIVLILNFDKILSQIHIGSSPTWSQFIYGVSIAMVGFTGIEAVSQLAGETKFPSKKVPKAMALIMVSVVVLYISISLIAMSALAPEKLISQYLEDPLSGIAQSFSEHPVTLNGSKIDFSIFLVPSVAILGGIILFIASNAGMIGASRLTFSMGSHFQLPKLLYKVHPVFKTPYISIIFITAIASFLVYFSHNITQLAALYNFGAMFSYAIAHLSLILLRIKEPERERPFKIWFNISIGNKKIPVTSIIGFLATFSSWIIITVSQPYGRNLGFLWIISGVIIYLWYRKKQKLPMVEAVDIEEIKIPEFKRMKFKHILVPTRGSALVEMLQSACKIAKEDGSKITAVYVIEIPENIPLDTFLPNEYNTSKKVLEHARAIALEYGITIDTMVVQARSAGQAIVDTANEINADLIVLGASNRPRYENALFGTTVDYVIKNAKCRVWASFASPDLPR